MREPSKRLFFTLVASTVLAACTTFGRADDYTLAKTKVEGAIQGRPALGLPIAIPGHLTVLIPFSLESRKWFFQDSDPYTRGGHASLAGSPYEDGFFLPAQPAYGGTVRWHNAIVRDPESGEQWPILTRRGVIERWRVLGRTPWTDEPFRSEGLVFVATIDDSNHDGYLDDRDASVAFVTEGDGRNPRPVTPPSAQVWDFSYDEANSRLFLLVVSDTNADGEFTNADAPVPFVLDVPGSDPAVPVVSDELRQRVEALLR